MAHLQLCRRPRHIDQGSNWRKRKMPVLWTAVFHWPTIMIITITTNTIIFFKSNNNCSCFFIYLILTAIITVSAYRLTPGRQVHAPRLSPAWPVELPAGHSPHMKSRVQKEFGSRTCEATRFFLCSCSLHFFCPTCTFPYFSENRQNCELST